MTSATTAGCVFSGVHSVLMFAASGVLYFHRLQPDTADILSGIVFFLFLCLKFPADRRSRWLCFVGRPSPVSAGGSFDPTEKIHHAAQYNLQHGTGNTERAGPTTSDPTRKTYVRTRYTVVNVAT